MDKILVTGATGRLGANIVHQLLARNYQVKALSIPADPNRGKLVGLDVEIVEGDLRNPALYGTLFTGVDSVIHTANILGPPPGIDTETFFDINTKGTFLLVDAAAQQADRLDRFVHVSSDAVYPMGNHLVKPSYQPVDELHPKRPNRLYALTKMLNEEMLKAYRRSHGLRTALIRPAGMFAGKEILASWTVGFVLNMLWGAMQRPESGLYHPALGDAIAELEAKSESHEQLCDARDQSGRSWLYSPADARDVAHACVCALEQPNAIGEAFNAAVPKPFSFAEVAGYLSPRTGQSICSIDLPVRWVYWSDISKAKSLIGYRPGGTLERVFDTALAHQAGEPVDLVPA